MKKNYNFILFFVAASITVCAQQYAPRTQFYETRLAYNPAVAGSEKEVPILVNFRQQWVGLDDAPVTQALYAHGFLGKGMGMGAVLYNDLAGPSRNSGLQISAARHFAMDGTGKRWLSFGMSLMLYQFRFDTDRLKTDIQNDPAVMNLARQNSRLTPDLSSGVYINDDNGYVGISCQNIIQNQLDLFNKESSANSIERTYYFLAGYKFATNPDFSIEPLTQIKLTEVGAWQGNFMVKTHYKTYWAGLSYSTGDAVGILLGGRKDIFSFSYSYDYPVSKIQTFNKGTHEITVGGFLFNSLGRTGPLEKREERRKHFNSQSRKRRF
jgi:type IX secretion system PorP/SprF family membrane protein